MGQNLFEDADSEEDISKIEVDQDFVRRFEHNKRREDLHRLEELKKRGEISDSSSSSSSEEEDEEVIKGTKESDLRFYDAILRVKRNDPAIYDKNVKLFSSSSDEEEEEEEEEIKKKKEKPMYLKDVVAKHLIEDGPEFAEEEDGKVGELRSKSYLEEQEENKRAFLEAAEETRESEGEDLFKEKKRLIDKEDEDDEEIHHKLDEVFGKDENLDENEAFLKNFFLKKLWVDESFRVDEADLAEVSEEEEEIERAEKYEAAFNFRHQEEGGDRIEAHSRIVKDTVRKTKSSRKLKRKNKAERLLQAEKERREEVKRLKNEKKKEIREKLEKIKSIAGMSKSDGCVLDEDDLEEDFDPEEYDRKMKKMFDADYYGAEDDKKKPDLDEEYELLDLPKDWMHDSDSDSKNLKDEVPIESQVEEELKSKRKRKRKISLHEKVELDKALEEYYNLDYEGTIGDLKTRFKYKAVPPNRFGLSTEEILMADDKELNKYVSLKKIAPYREEEWKVPREKRFHLKINKKLILGSEGDEMEREKEKKKREKEKKKRENGEDDSEKGDSKSEVSRRRKRRQRQKELKISQSRLAMYGKV